MDLLELLLSIPDLVALVFYVLQGVWWLLKGLGMLLGLVVRGIGRGCGWLLERLRERVRSRDFPRTTVTWDQLSYGRASPPSASTPTTSSTRPAHRSCR